MSEKPITYVEELGSMYLGDEEFGLWIAVEPYGALSPTQFSEVTIPSYLKPIVLPSSR